MTVLYASYGIYTLYGLFAVYATFAHLGANPVVAAVGIAVIILILLAYVALNTRISIKEEG